EQADVAELIMLARSADLIIVGQVKLDSRPVPKWRPEEIVVACGRPVLVVPYIGGYTRVGRRVLVAWDGSREAARALNDALPLIGAAEEVTIVAVNTRSKDVSYESQSLKNIVRHLARHCIAARKEELWPAGGGIADLILSRSSDLNADLIVAGAY